MRQFTTKVKLKESGSRMEYCIRFPAEAHELDQHEEWCEVELDGDWHRIRFHDYHEIYEKPGLYEGVFYEALKCNSPERVVGLLEDVLDDHDDQMEDLSVLDIGAGNGMVGEELKSAGARELVGIDIIEEAKGATLRDRPDVYKKYFITDLTDLPEQHEEELRKDRLNCIACVAALGYGDIPSTAFVKALDMIDTPGWMAFNIKEDFLDHQHDSDFAGLIHRLRRDKVIRVEALRRYRHRLSVAGEPLHYVAMVARKLKDVPDNYLAPTE